MRTKFLLSLTLGFLALGACAIESDLGLFNRVQNKATIDLSVNQWNSPKPDPKVQTEALHSLLSCAKDESITVETRAYCVHQLNNLSGKSVEANNEINGLILPVRVAKMSKIFEELDHIPAR